MQRIYLRHPEHGTAELEAARAGRRHRGHWKQQWYASIEEHRTAWIEGYPLREDFAAGTVTGPKVLIDPGPHPPPPTSPPPPGRAPSRSAGA